MSQYRVLAISDAVAEAVRANLRSPQYGHPAYVELAAGFGPCRSCLRTFNEGQEERVLFTYNTFSDTTITPLPGPVFIHRDACAPYAEAGMPSDLNTLDLLVEAYNEDGSVIAWEHPAPGNVEDAVLKLFSTQEARFLHLRNAKAGCYVARVERLTEDATR